MNQQTSGKQKTRVWGAGLFGGPWRQAPGRVLLLLCLAGAMSWVGLVRGVSGQEATQSSQQSAAPRGDVGASIKNTRTALSEWVENQRLMAKKRRKWAMQKELLTDRIRLLETEIKSLRGQIEAKKEQIAKNQKEQEILQKQDQRLKDTIAALTETVSELEKRTRRLLGRMPETVRGEVAMLSDRLPDDPQKTELSLVKRVMTIIAILNKLNEFNMDVTLTREVRDLSSGKRVEVRVVYVGLGQAYYVSENAQFAGIGRPGPDGWGWKAVNGAAPQIAKAIRILEKKTTAAYVQLPIDIN
jgi:regulator of replication initiation timing